MAARAREFAPAPGRVAFVLEGGYDLEALSRSAGAVVAAVLGEVYRPEPSTSGGPGRRAVERAGDAHRRAMEGCGTPRDS